jgi:SAM-dependent methyltransferase
MLGPEVLRMHSRRHADGFYRKYMSGRGLDFGYRGSLGDEAEPVLGNCKGVDLGTPGYDGITYDAPPGSFDFVFSSHCLEHVDRPELNIREWHRLVRVGGYIIIIVPHQFLYEKKYSLPSRFNGDHRAFYTPCSLLAVVELALEPNSYRVVHCRDNATGYNYEIPPDKHCDGAAEIELVLRRIELPKWRLDR